MNFFIVKKKIVEGIRKVLPLNIELMPASYPRITYLPKCDLCLRRMFLVDAPIQRSQITQISADSELIEEKDSFQPEDFLLTQGPPLSVSGQLYAAKAAMNSKSPEPLM